MDLSIVTNFFNFLLTYNIVLLLKQCFKVILGTQVSDYAELTPISTVITLYNDLFRLLFTISGAVAHGFSFKYHRLLVAHKVFEEECEKISDPRMLDCKILGLIPQILESLRIMSETWVPDPETWPSSVAAMEEYYGGDKLKTFIKLVNKVAPKKKFDFWKGCLLYHMLGVQIFRAHYGNVLFACQDKEFLANTRATLDIAKKLRARDLEHTYVLDVEKGEHKVVVAISAQGSIVYYEPRIFERRFADGIRSAKIRAIADSVAYDHNLESQKVYDAVLQAIETYALYKKIPVEATYKATGVLYNPSSSPAFANDSGRF